jgi:transcriptional regulator with XRE-family HTH domain
MTGDTAFGPRLRTARLRAGMSQSELERVAGVPKTRLSRYENGHFLPSLTTLHKICDALEVSESSLMGDEMPTDRFLTTLKVRGVDFGSVTEAETLANRVADLLAPDVTVPLVVTAHADPA